MAIKESSKPFLSICIPTFNREDKTLKLVENLLLHKGNDIEIIVLDNCSTDNTQNALKSINDKRFFYISNEINIGSMPNVLKSLSLGTGKFLMLCLDKDFIFQENLSLFIERLKGYEDVSVGYCSLNYQNIENDNSYSKGLESLLNLAYISEHPSGIFFRRSILEKENIIVKILENDKTFAFNTEILKAEMCILGNSKKINIPLVFTEKLEDCEKEVSHTYKGSNIYFFPDNIQRTFKVYINHLFSLDIVQKEKVIILKRIFSALLMASTFGFKGIMKNKSLCAHHGISVRDITGKELLYNATNFSKHFLSSHFQISFLSKLSICTGANSKIIYAVFKSKFNKMQNK